MMAYGIKHHPFLAAAIVLASCSGSSAAKTLHQASRSRRPHLYRVMITGGSTQAYARRWDQLKARAQRSSSAVAKHRRQPYSLICRMLALEPKLPQGSMGSAKLANSCRRTGSLDR